MPWYRGGDLTLAIRAPTVKQSPIFSSGGKIGLFPTGIRRLKRTRTGSKAISQVYSALSSGMTSRANRCIEANTS